MTNPARRRFSISDALVLVGACAVGLAPLRATLGLDLMNNQAWTGLTTPGRLSLAITVFGFPPLVALTIAVLALSFSGLRRPLRLRFRRPGFVACVVALLAVAYNISNFAFQVIFSTTPRGSMHYVNLATGTPYNAGLMVIASWLPMMLGGRWRRPSSWVDRAGCALGVCWIALFLESQAYQLVRMMFRL